MNAQKVAGYSTNLGAATEKARLPLVFKLSNGVQQAGEMRGSFNRCFLQSSLIREWSELTCKYRNIIHFCQKWSQQCEYDKKKPQKAVYLHNWLPRKVRHGSTRPPRFTHSKILNPPALFTFIQNLNGRFFAETYLSMFLLAQQVIVKLFVRAMPDNVPSTSFIYSIETEGVCVLKEINLINSISVEYGISFHTQFDFCSLPRRPIRLRIALLFCVSKVLYHVHDLGKLAGTSRIFFAGNLEK